MDRAPGRWVWIGPARKSSSAGRFARACLRGLRFLGAEVAAIDPDIPEVEIADDLADCFLAPVLTKGATVVYQGTPPEISELSDYFPSRRAERRIACVRHHPAIRQDSWASLNKFDFVAVGNWVEFELLSLAGVDRKRLRVLPVPLPEPLARRHQRSDSEPCFRVLTDFRDATLSGVEQLVLAWSQLEKSSHAQELILACTDSSSVATLLPILSKRLHQVFGGDASTSTGIRCVGGLGNEESAGSLLDEADLAIDLATLPSFLPLHLESAAAGIPTLVANDQNVAPVSSIEGLETTEVSQARLLEHLVRRSRSFHANPERSPRSLPGTSTSAGTARVLLDIEHESARPSADELTRVLDRVGLHTPENLIEGARTEAFIHVFSEAEDTWRDPLARFAKSTRATDDATLILWLDGQSVDGLDQLAAQVSSELARHCGSEAPPDIQLLVAPRDHVPWHRVKPLPSC